MKIKGLFWKIFGAFWLASLSIMFATSYVILTTVETEKYRALYERTLRDFAARAIYRYENTPPGVQQKFLMRRYTRGPRGSISHRQIVQVRHNDQVLFEREHALALRGDTFVFEIISDRGNRYLITALEPRPPRLLLDTLKRLNTLQFFIILIASTLVSFLLSWSITRPLKKLGAASRRFADGVLTTQIDQRLLARADELGDLARDFSFMMQQTQQTLQAQKQLLHDVSHELRAPLSRLQVAAELIQQRDEVSSLYIQRIHNECERIDQLIQRILNFARLEEATIADDTVDLVTLLQNQIDNIHFEYPSRDIRFVKEKSTAIINGDSNLLGEAVDNILRNACKYTPDDAPIDVAITEDAQQVTIEIRDFGPGVAAEELAKLTKPFFRSGNRMHGDGFGLGLSIAQRAVDKHKGRLILDNHPNGGLCVMVLLPRQFVAGAA